jgi:hypothetical protein
MMFNAWNNLPWTSRGLKVKHHIEAILMVATFFLVMGLVGHFE